MTIQETIESTEQTNEPGNPQSIDENIVDKPPLAKLESLVTALTERIALLEDKQDEAIRDVPLREQSVRFANEVNANDGRRVSISGSKKFSEIENGVGCGLKDDELSERLDLIERRIEDFEDIKSDSDGDDEKYKLPESTFSLFITHHPLSVPFAFAVFTTALSTCCLGLTLAESVSNGTQGNILGIPGGVSDAVRAAQFFGAIVGVLMEDEIPQGLQLIANGLAHELILNGQKRVHYRVISSSFLRLIVGYLFLSSLFINVAQNSDVISIFYDVLALEFVENIDDTAYALAKKGFFGKSLLIATNQRYTLESPEERSSTVVKSGPRSRGSILRDPDSLRRNASFVGLMASNNRPNRISRFIYFLNAAIVLSGLAYMTVKQKQGAYRCNTLTVTFNEDIWEHAIAKQVDGKETEQKLLIYSYFSGIYKESGSYGGYPMYVEQNKNDGEPFKNTVGAEIKYCQEISAWVFMHPLIMTSNNGEEENECSWLMRSRETLDYDFINVAGESSFDVWTGEITQGSSITVTCNECSERSDCNYHGSCSSSGFCLCDDDRFGDHCEFELPCEFLATEKAGQIDDMTRWNPDNPIRLVTGEGGFKHNRVYNRPVYVQRNLSGEPYDLRKYDIRQKITVAPSTAPSAWPTRNPTYHPTTTPNKQPASNSSPEAIPAISLGATYPPTVLLESDGIWDDDVSDMFKEEPVHQENQYEENVPDFADWDDFFEMPELHDLTDFMEKYAVILAFTGSRYYGTMISPDSEFDDLFPEDYHAFWDDSFSLKRTFIISDTTFASSPAGVDFFEMRRRVNSELNPFVEFSYGPYGVLIPLVNYVGAGFFHCLSSDATAVKSLGGDDLDSYTGATLLPSYYPTVSLSPSTTLSPSHPPVFSTNCYRLDVQILYDKFPSDTSWLIFDEMNQTVPVSEYFYDDDRNPVNKPAILGSSEANACLPEGKYYFVVYDSSGDGFTKDDFGYNLRFYGYLIAEGWNFTWNETVVVNIPFHGTPRPTSNPAPSSSSGESTYHESLLFDITCSPIEVHISYDASPLDIIWSISSLFPNDMTVTVDEEFFEENGNVVDEPTPFGSARGRTCLPDGDYEFLILDNYFGVGGNYSSTTYQVVEASSGAIIGEGGEIVKEERFTFSIPFVQSVQPSPTLPSDQNITRLGCHDVRIAVVYDNAPVGVTWVLNKLEFGDGDTETERLIRFFTATNSSLANLPLSTELCLEDGNYVFNIYDGLGDGICCNDGDGYYAIVVNDQLIAKGGDFEFQDTVSFSLPMNGDE